MKFQGLKFSLAIVLVGLFAGCSDEPLSQDEKVVTREVVITNVVNITREVVVTNVVELTTTNIIELVKKPILSPRKTAPYLVSAPSLRLSELNDLLRASGVRIISSDPGAMAIVEAPSKVANELAIGGVMCVHVLTPEDKMGSEVGEKVKITPLSSIDIKIVADAVRELEGELTQVVSTPRPLVRATLKYTALNELVKRGYILKIERDE